MPFIETADGTSLFYNDWGSGRPVLFMHGWSLNSDIWEYQMPYVVDAGLRAVAYDRRGHGRSSDPGGGYDFDTLADDLATVIAARRLADVTLVGHSMAAGEIARYLTRHGTTAIARVVLVAPITPCVFKTTDNPDGIDAAFFDTVAAALATDRPKFLSDGAPAFFGVATGEHALSAEMVRWGIDVALQASPKAALECLRAYSRTDFRADMKAFTVPTLIIHGDADHSAPLELTGRKTAHAIRGSRLEVYAGAPHAVFIVEKDRFNQMLVEFVTTGSAGRA